VVLDVRCLGRLCEICGLLNSDLATLRRVADGASLDDIWEQPPYPTSTQHRRARHPLEADLISLTRNVRSRLVFLGGRAAKGCNPRRRETINQAATLFVSTFSTLLAIINPLESLPVFLRLLEG
jgi:hypothetical protein